MSDWDEHNVEEKTRSSITANQTLFHDHQVMEMAVGDTELEAVKREAERNPERAYRQAGYDAKLNRDGDRLKADLAPKNESRCSVSI